MAFMVKNELVTSVRVGESWEDVLPGTFTVDSLGWTQGGGEVGDRTMGFHAVLAGGGGIIAGPLSGVTGIRCTAE